MARAVAGEPVILLADEPTGNLDSKSGEAVMELLRELHQTGATICMVTHDPRYARHADRNIHLFDGRVVDGPMEAADEPSWNAAPGSTLMLISLRNLERSYPQGPAQSYVLRRITLDIKAGEFVSIMGPSGAGKSTLLHILGMHDAGWSGEYTSSISRSTPWARSSAPSCTSGTSGSCSRAITCSTT